MAQYEWVTDGSTSQQILNIDGKVGPRCSNYPDDVIVVEAMLAYYKSYDDFAPDIVIRRPMNIWTPNTSLLITRYQEYINGNPLNDTTLKVDGIVGRARGKAEWGYRRRWTIVQLSYDCDWITNQNGKGDWILNIRDKWKEVDKALGRRESIM